MDLVLKDIEPMLGSANVFAAPIDSHDHAELPGDGRLEQAIQDALRSPLLNNNEISNAKKILFNISFSSNTQEADSNELRMDEVRYMTEFMKQFGKDIEVI